MSTLIRHQDGFQVRFRLFGQPLTIYDSIFVEENDQRKPSIEHVGDLSGPMNKVYIVPESGLVNAYSDILPGFDALSGNAVLVAFHIPNADGHKEKSQTDLLLRSADGTWQPETPSGACWLKVLQKEASQGTMLITFTRGNAKPPQGKFVPLSSEHVAPYSIEVGWRVAKTRPEGDSDAEDAQPEAMHDSSPTPQARPSERTRKPADSVSTPGIPMLGNSTKKAVSAEPYAAKSIADNESSDNHDNSLGPEAEPSTRGKEQATSAFEADREETPNVGEADQTRALAPVSTDQSHNASTRSTILPTPLTGSNEMPVAIPSIVGRLGPLTVSTTVPQNNSSHPNAHKRSAAEAFQISDLPLGDRVEYLNHMVTEAKARYETARIEGLIVSRGVGGVRRVVQWHEKQLEMAEAILARYQASLRLEDELGSDKAGEPYLYLLRHRAFAEGSVTKMKQNLIVAKHAARPEGHQ